MAYKPENINDYSEPLEKANGIMAEIEGVEDILRALREKLESLRQERESILNDPEIKTGKKPLPEDWPKFDAKILKCEKAIQELEESQKDLLHKYRNANLHHEGQRKYMDELDEETAPIN